MKINLFDKDLNRIAIIGNNFVSCLWSEGYNSIESCTLELQATDELKSKIKPDCYLGRNDRNTLMVIKSVEIADNKITAYGFTAGRVLDDVAFIGTINDNTIIDNALKSAYNSSSKYYNLEYRQSGLQDKFSQQISHKSILELMETMCQSEDIGFRVIEDNQKLIAELYKPAEKPNLVFAQQFGNIQIENILLGLENEKNFAIVLGQGEGTDRVRVDVDLSNGTQHKELIIDARNEQQEETETLEDYKKRLYSVGFEKLVEQSKTWECSFIPSTDEFGKKYDLGDILDIYLDEYGVEMKARLKRFEQLEQDNSTETKVEVGDITILRR